VERLAGEGDQRKVRILNDPRMPGLEEIRRHEINHCPYRNWCAHCVFGRGKDLDHRKGIEEERGLHEFAFDYCFPGDELGYKITLLVGRERLTGMIMSTTVPAKGSLGTFACDKVMQFLDECGCSENDVVIKTDQEPAIEFLMKDVKEARTKARTLIEEAPKQSKGSNGMAERAVQAIEGMVRTMKSALEERVGRSIKAEAPIITFMAEHASYLINRMEVGKDGKTSYERNKGKRSTVLGVEFGEKMMVKKFAKTKMEKLNPRWYYGIFVGVKRSSGEIFVSTQDGIKKARSVRRLPVEKRWCEDCIEWVKFVPWNKYRGDDEADGEIPEEALRDPFVRRDEAPDVRPGGEGQPGAITIKMRQPPPRAFYISKQNIKDHKYTRGCPGCGSVFKGGSRQPHNELCRARFEELLKDDARVKNAKRKQEEYEDKVVKKAKDKKERKKRGREEEGE
jgi:hypothetical protein